MLHDQIWSDHVRGESYILSLKVRVSHRVEIMGDGGFGGAYLKINTILKKDNL